MDIMGPISPPSAKGHRFILAVTITSLNGQRQFLSEKLRPRMSSSLSNTMWSIASVFPDRSCMIMDRNSSAILSSGFALNLEYKVYPPRHIIRQLMASLKPSTKLSGNCSRSSSLVQNAIGTKSLGSAFGHTVPRCELRQRLLLSLWSTEQRLSSPWKSRSRLFKSLWHLRW